MPFDLHPQLVHFPIVLILVSLVIQSIHVFRQRDGISISAFIFSAAGLITGFAAALTGQKAEKNLDISNEEPWHSVIENHESFANLTIWILLPLMIAWAFYLLKKQRYQSIEIIILLLLMVISGFVLYTAYLGGSLVFDFGVGVRRP